MKNQAFFAVIFAAILVGTSGLFIKHMSINAFSQAWLRMGVPAIFTVIWMLVKGIPFFRGNWKKMTLTSVIATVRLLLFFVGFIYTSIGNAIILFYTFPIWAAILGSVFLKEKISQKQKGLLVLAFLGIVFIFSQKEFSLADRDFIGMMASLASAFFHAVTVILFKSEGDNFSKNEILFYQNIIGFLVLIPFFQYSEATPKDFILGISYGALVGIVGYGLFFYGLKKLMASTASAIMYMEVVSAVVLGYLFLEERLSPSMLIGGVIVVGSSFLLGQLKSVKSEE